MMFELTGKTILITGAGSGIGLSFARGFAGQGATVICTDRDESRVREAVAAIPRAEGFTVDVSDADSVQSLAHQLGSRRIDGLVNNAGVSSLAARTHELPIPEWDRLVAINLRGVFLTSRAIIPLMLAHGGSIINIASIMGLVGYYPGRPMNCVNYAATKAGVIGLTRQIAVEYAKEGIRANAIAPGYIAGTRLGDASRAKLGTDGAAERERTIAASTPIGRRGTLDELLGLAIYLASDASRYMTGQVIAYDGGWTAQ